jgi:hypothetical protein
MRTAKSTPEALTAGCRTRVRKVLRERGVPVLVGEEPVVADIGMPSPALLDSAGPDFVGDRGIYQPEAVAYPLGLDRDEVGSTAESRDRSVST